MATKKKSAKKSHAGEIAVLGAAALAAAGAGYYFYGDKSAKKHRQAANKWAKGMHATVLKEAKKDWKKFQKLDKKAVAAIVDSASAAYVGMRNVDRNDVMAAANELKNNWQTIQAELADAGKKSGRAVKKAAKKVAAKPKKAIAKKTAKKAPKKAAGKKSAKKR